jgi:predicted O-methyltransferase YrrM
MNAVLENIVSSQQEPDGNFIGRAEGDLLQKLIKDLKPERTLEIGCAYGVSTLYICEAVAALPAFTQHIVIDPYQRTVWRSTGLKHVVDAGYGFLLDFREQPSELVLPALVKAGMTVDFAFIDGLHTLDEVKTEFDDLDRLVRVGGVIAFNERGHSRRAA